MLMRQGFLTDLLQKVCRDCSHFLQLCAFLRILLASKLLLHGANTILLTQFGVETGIVMQVEKTTETVEVLENLVLKLRRRDLLRALNQMCLNVVG